MPYGEVRERLTGQSGKRMGKMVQVVKVGIVTWKSAFLNLDVERPRGILIWSGSFPNMKLLVS